MDENDNNNPTSEYEQEVAKEFQRLAALREAVKEKLSGKELEDPETMKIAKETVLDLIPDAAVTVRYLILHADSETIRKDLSKWILQIAMNDRSQSNEDDELQKFLDTITKTNHDIKSSDDKA